MGGWDASRFRSDCLGLSRHFDTERPAAAVRDKLQSAVTQAVSMAETKKRFEELGYVTITDTPQEFAKFLHEDIDKMARLIKQYNLKPE